MFAPRYTSKFLCFYGLCEFKKGLSPKTVSGSSRYNFVEGELLVKKRKIYEQKEKPLVQEKKEKEKKQYSLNKKVIKRKIFAMYHLPNADRYFRLWTLTFPCGTTDEVGYEILNNWLTRMRKELGLKHYIWVAERQKNGTLHFHFIFCQYLDVTQANYFAKKAVNNAIKKGKITANYSSYDKYNGLDISKKIGNFEAVAKYLTKYVTKNNTTSDRLPYYCSQSVSRLFTCSWVTDDELAEYVNKGCLTINNSPIIEHKEFNFFGIKVHNYNTVFANLFNINAMIIEQESRDIGFI